MSLRSLCLRESRSSREGAAGGVVLHTARAGCRTQQGAPCRPTALKWRKWGRCT